MNTDLETLKVIPNGKPMRVFLPLKDISERIRAQCLYQETTPPRFSIVFQPGTLPKEYLDLNQSCIISVDMGGPNVSLEARINKIINPQTLELSLHRTISHEQMREFFRVDAITKVISSSFQAGFPGRDGKDWAVQGQTVDISGSGILAIFKEKVPEETQIRLTISIPLPSPESIEVLAHPVRSQQLGDGRYEIAFHFDDISTEDRDKIIGCCLTIQRKMLRLKVQVKDKL